MLDNTSYDWDASFNDLLQRARHSGAIASDDIVGALRSLLDECRDIHEAGRVAALERFDLLAVTPGGELTLGKVPISAPVSIPDIAEIDAADILGSDSEDGLIGAMGSRPRSPLFYAGYTSWEVLAGQHDALTDIFHLGMLMASLATGLDFRDTHDLATFVRNRHHLVRLNPDLHPVLARVISDMTRLRRSERAADLSALLDLIDDYRSLEVDDAEAKASDLADVTDPATRRERTLEYFRNRLFEVTRRNKLLYFADRHGVNLTRGSLPVMLDYTSLRARQLLTTDAELLERLGTLNERGESKGELDLRRWLQCADYPFLAPTLDKVRSAARKDSRELGFNQLRFVLAFLRWHDDERAERINTPFVMLPVSLKKQAGTTDGFSLVLEAPVTEAEINPVLRYIMNDRFGITLPELIDMTSLAALRELGRALETAAGAMRPGLQVQFGETPHVPALLAANRQQLDEHRRRQRKVSAKLKDWRGIGYSYATDTYQPLGMELFDRFVRERPSLLRRESGMPTPHVASGLPSVAELNAPVGTGTARDGGEQNDPRFWEIDLCAITLANFNTRKMSLVRDYEVLHEDYPGRHDNYARLFDRQSRPALLPVALPPHTERNTVLPSDPSQDEAVLRATTGESYVIQGPPGTGKSQTIANLLADLAANGKSVLFVCEKRVALDVVHKRLRDAGIGDLASLVHDAREDRLGFIANLKTLYESWLASRPSRTIRDKHAAAVSDVGALSEKLRLYSAAMQRFIGSGDTTVRDLMGLAFEHTIPRPRISLREREATPPWAVFVAGENEMVRLDQLLPGKAIDRERVFAVAGVLPTNLADRPDAGAFMETALPRARDGLAAFSAASPHGAPLDASGNIGLATLLAQSALAHRIGPLASIGRLDLLDVTSPAAEALRAQLTRLAALAERSRVPDAAADVALWKRQPTYAEAKRWLGLARRYGGALWAFVSRDWRIAQQEISACFVGPPNRLVGALEHIVAAHEVEARYDTLAHEIVQTLGVDDLSVLTQGLASFWDQAGEWHPAELSLLRAIRANPDTAASRVLALASDHPSLVSAQEAIGRLFPKLKDPTEPVLSGHIATLDEIDGDIIEIATALRALDYASPGLGQALRRAPMAFETLRGAALHLELQRFFNQHDDVQRVTARELQATSRDLDAKLAELRTQNARRILDERKSRFRGRAGAPSETYDVGRAFLEHQFSLLRPSAALRDFLTGAPGVVVRDLKPIWMMSPLSVADTLPLDEGLFDVVVFDEASQIPIEDALPTLYRAPQMIVVGDEMQLPPPSYFGRKIEADENDLPDYIAFGMQAESLLDKAAATLPATRLEWHYRSRHESLIGFCNQAFYDGRLRTIPSQKPLAGLGAIDTRLAAPMREMAQRVLNRPISFHQLHDAAYVGQRNTAEAVYIADLVRALLSQDASKTIGIVAFSQAQQGAIEDALERLAADNPPFRQRLERAMGLDHEELFVKNLENVQGDERDIIIVSVAYGPGATGRMIMNFGPINQEGGEKRLNVIFSRAKHHIAVVASFDPEQITNDWNKGARALKNYLSYAAAVSTGDEARMRAALAGYPGADLVAKAAAASDPLADFIAAAYRQQGRSVVRGLGQSTARCDIALKPPGGTAAFSTAILTDNAAHYGIVDVIDRYVTYPGLLRAAGWSVEFGFAKDWLQRLPRQED